MIPETTPPSVPTNAGMALPMRIALLSFEYPPETGFGGIGTYTWYQARALAFLGHEVHVLCGATKQTLLRSSTHESVTIYRYRAGGFAMRTLQRLGKHGLWWTKSRLETAWVHAPRAEGTAPQLRIRLCRDVSRITHFEGRVIALFHGLPAGISGAL
jgi:hypothetical protein